MAGAGTAFHSPEVKSMGLRDKYAHAIQTAKGKFQGNAEERDGKLHWNGYVASEAEKAEIWTAIKTVPGYQNEITGDIQVRPPAGGGGKTYTVKAGDTLSKIAKSELGDANAYMKIFEANRDQLSDPDKIKPGQVLKIG
jgi:nucleoid-associated protein YgaU